MKTLSNMQQKVQFDLRMFIFYTIKLFFQIESAVSR